MAHVQQSGIRNRLVRRVRQRRCEWGLAAWVKELLRRKPPTLVAVPLDDKLARIASKMMITGETYARPNATPASDER